jgi:hypothetical protein
MNPRPLNRETPAIGERPQPTLGIFQEWAARARGETPVLTPVLPSRFESSLSPTLEFKSEKTPSVMENEEATPILFGEKDTHSKPTDVHFRRTDGQIKTSDAINNPNPTETQFAPINRVTESPTDTIHESERRTRPNSFRRTTPSALPPLSPLASTQSTQPQNQIPHELLKGERDTMAVHQANGIEAATPWFIPSPSQSPARDPVTPVTSSQLPIRQPDLPITKRDKNDFPLKESQWRSRGNPTDLRNDVIEKTILPKGNLSRKSQEMTMAQRMGSLPDIRASEHASPKQPSRHSQVTPESVATSPPQIHIRIGRVDIRAVTQPAPSRPAPPRPTVPVLDLEGYLRSLDRSTR